MKVLGGVLSVSLSLPRHVQPPVPRDCVVRPGGTTNMAAQSFCIVTVRVCFVSRRPRYITFGGFSRGRGWPRHVAEEGTWRRRELTRFADVLADFLLIVQQLIVPRCKVGGVWRRHAQAET